MKLLTNTIMLLLASTFVVLADDASPTAENRGTELTRLRAEVKMLRSSMALRIEIIRTLEAQVEKLKSENTSLMKQLAAAKAAAASQPATTRPATTQPATTKMALDTAKAEKWKQEEAKQPERKELIQKLINQGVFRKVEFRDRVATIWVDSSFSLLDFDAKSDFCSVVYAYVAANAKDELVSVRLKDAQSGKTIGDYGQQWTGFGLKMK